MRLLGTFVRVVAHRVLFPLPAPPSSSLTEPPPCGLLASASTRTTQVPLRPPAPNRITSTERGATPRRVARRCSPISSCGRRALHTRAARRPGASNGRHHLTRRSSGATARVTHPIRAARRLRRPPGPRHGPADAPGPTNQVPGRPPRRPGSRARRSIGSTRSTCRSARRIAMRQPGQAGTAARHPRPGHRRRHQLGQHRAVDQVALPQPRHLSRARDGRAARLRLRAVPHSAARARAGPEHHARLLGRRRSAVGRSRGSALSSGFVRGITAHERGSTTTRRCGSSPSDSLRHAVDGGDRVVHDLALERVHRRQPGRLAGFEHARGGVRGKLRAAPHGGPGGAR